MEISFDNTEIAFSGKSDADLGRSYLLFRLVGNNKLVKIGKRLTYLAIKLKLPVKALVKATIFRQFCGGETIAECGSTITSLSKYKIKTILDYSIESKNSEIDFEHTMHEVVATIEIARTNKNIPFSVFKLTGLARFELLEKINEGIDLNEQEQEEWNLVKQRVNFICKTAYIAEFPVLIDAEESWIQNTIDELVLEMMQLYNTKKAIVYNTIQMYRTGRIEYLKQLSEKAREGNFFIGLKIVRGAYMEKERERAMEMNYISPIQIDKLSTDKDYDEALLYCIQHLDKIAICAGTHNEASSLFLLELMKELKIERNHQHIYFAQLLGMSDHISYNLANAGYNVAKYVPYGPVSEVLPYLIRRAEENTSVAGQTSRELNLILKERERRRSKKIH